MIKISQSYSRI